MDERLKNALEFSNYQKTLQLKLQSLRLTRDHNLTLSYNNHIFKNNKELIALVSVFAKDKKMIVYDVNDNPVQIDDIKDFLKILKDNYKKANEKFYKDFIELKKARNVKKLAGLS